MDNPLSNTVLTTKDLKDQPPSSHVLVTGEGKRGYACDYAICDEHMVQAYLRNGDKPVLVFGAPAKSSWNIINRDALEPLTEEVLMRRINEDAKAARELHKALNPELLKEMEEGGLNTEGHHGVYL